MPRVRNEERFGQLLDAGIRVFIASGGFRRTQVSDVARECGMAKGTVYLYVASKEALFDQCLRFAAGAELSSERPVPTPEPGATLRFLQDTLRDQGRGLRLYADDGVVDKGGSQAEEGLQDIVLEMYDLLCRFRALIKLVGTSAGDWPELATVWYGEGRAGLQASIEDYLRRGIARARFREVTDVSVGARMLMELVHWFAVQRWFDAQPQAMQEEHVKAVLCEAAVRTFVREQQER